MTGLIAQKKNKAFRSMTGKGFIRKRTELSHYEADSMVNDFIENRLNIEETKLYIEHISKCRECYEDLELVYMIGNTLRYLDEEEDASADLQKMLKTYIQKKASKVKIYDMHMKVYKYIILAVVIIVIIMLLDFTGVLPVTRLI